MMDVDKIARLCVRAAFVAAAGFILLGIGLGVAVSAVAS